MDTCAAATGNNANFGKIGAATIVDPDLLKGWGVRTHDYQTEVTLQQEVLPRVSAEVSYIHRTFHGFMVHQRPGPELPDGLAELHHHGAVGSAAAGRRRLSDQRLPGRTPRAATQNILKHEKHLGTDGKERDAFYDGVNFNVNARMQNGLFVSLGTQTGRRVDDRCNVVTNFNNGGTGPNPRDCRDVDPWQTTIRGLGSYTIPKVDVLVSATVRSQPPLAIGANWLVPNTHDPDAPRRHRCRRDCRATGNSTIDLTDSEHLLFADNRRTQVDMRFAKVVRFGRTRTDIGVDLWNLFNTNYATGYAGTRTRPGAARGRTRRPSTRRGSCA